MSAYRLIVLTWDTPTFAIFQTACSMCEMCDNLTHRAQGSFVLPNTPNLFLPLYVSQSSSSHTQLPQNHSRAFPQEDPRCHPQICSLLWSRLLMSKRSFSPRPCVPCLMIKQILDMFLVEGWPLLFKMSLGVLLEMRPLLEVRVFQPSPEIKEEEFQLAYLPVGRGL